MKIFVNTLFLRPEFINTTVSDDIIDIGREMNVFFGNKSYSPLVEEIQIRISCQSYFYKPYKRPQYMEDVKGKTPCPDVFFPIYHTLFVDVLIDPIDGLLNAKGSEVSTIVGREIIAYFEKVKLPLKIRKSFDKERFISDLRTFFNIPNSIKKDAFTAEIESVASKSELLDELNKKLQFPPYFGFNWDALHELLRDFSWIPQKNITIVHKGLSLPPKDYEVYMSIVNDSVRFWQNYPDEHVLSFDFT